MSKKQRYSPVVRERAVRMVLNHQSEYPSRWQAIVSIAGNFCCTPESLRRLIKLIEVDTGRRGGLTSDDWARIKELERENRELRQTNEMCLWASYL